QVDQQLAMLLEPIRGEWGPSAPSQRHHRLLGLPGIDHGLGVDVAEVELEPATVDAHARLDGGRALERQPTIPRELEGRKEPRSGDEIDGRLPAEVLPDPHVEAKD